MTLPPLYKYLDVEGAILTLRNGNFKHAKPSEFNDIEDLTIRSIFPESEEATLQEIKDNFTDVLLKNLDRAPTCTNPQMRQQLKVIQNVYRTNADAAKTIKDINKKDSISKLYDLDGLKERSKGYVNEINEFLQGFRVLCVSQDNTSVQMWERYAQGSQGIVLRILPSTEKDSKFLQFRQVKYRSTRPPLYPNVLEYLESSLFDNQEERVLKIMNEIIYSKTLAWEYEDEYRLVIPILDGQDWRLMPYYPEEIELYLGRNASDETKAEIIELAKMRNPKIKIFHTCVGPSGRLLFL